MQQPNRVLMADDFFRGAIAPSVPTVRWDINHGPGGGTTAGY